MTETNSTGPAGSAAVLTWRGQMEDRRAHLLADLASNPPIVDQRVTELQEIESLLGRSPSVVGPRVGVQASPERRGAGRPRDTYPKRQRLLELFADGEQHNLVNAALSAGYSRGSARALTNRFPELERVGQGVYRLRAKEAS